MSAHNDDVSAVVLTIGEATTERAIESLHRQTLAPREIVVVSNIRPFYNALNTGVAKVRTPFFIQVDADMILDPQCIEQLRQAVRPNSGIIFGHLRDALIEEVVGVKLFRTECFTTAGMLDSMSPDTDFGRKIAAAGWKTVELGKASLATEAERPTTMGEHCPSYTVPYTYAKYRLEGRRYRYRQRLSGIRWHFDRLEASKHPAALVAQIGLSQGIFIDTERDLTGSVHGAEELAALEWFLRSSVKLSAKASRIPLNNASVEIFRLSYSIGCDLFRAADLDTFKLRLGSLRTRHNDRAWIAKIGLCRGLLATTTDRKAIDDDYQVLLGFFRGGDGEGALNRVMELGRKLRKVLLHSDHSSPDKRD
jgi:glycosyltransferase involved in cell wall biosynthesis